MISLTAAVATVTFRIPEWGTVTIIEAAWTAVGIVGVAVTTYALWHLRGDREALNVVDESDAAKREAADLIWRSHRQREALRFVQMMIIVGIGVWAMSQGSVVRPAVATVTTLIITGFFTVVVAITVAQSIKDGRTRRRVTDLLR